MPPENNQVTEPKEHDSKTLMGILSYLGPLVIISYFVAKDDPFVKFHIKQGLVIFAISVLVWLFLSGMFVWSALASLLNLATFVLAVIGIINVVQKKEKELPIVGGLAKFLTF